MSEEEIRSESAESQPAEKEKLEEGRALAILEGLLYVVGDDGLSEEQAAQALDLKPDQAHDLLIQLQNEYNDEKHGIEAVQYGGKWRFLSKDFIAEYGKRLFSLGKKNRLSQAALETLAIIAYKQPITRVEIEEIRGVSADVMLRKLEARDLIRESGRSDAPGRPILYEVTDEFMNSFSLVSLKELPALPTFDQDQDSDSDLFKQ